MCDACMAPCSLCWSFSFASVFLRAASDTSTNTAESACEEEVDPLASSARVPKIGSVPQVEHMTTEVDVGDNIASLRNSSWMCIVRQRLAQVCGPAGNKLSPATTEATPRPRLVSACVIFVWIRVRMRACADSRRLLDCSEPCDVFWWARPTPRNNVSACIKYMSKGRTCNGLNGDTNGL